MLFPWEQCNFNSVLWLDGNLLRAGYFNYVVAMPALTRGEVKWSNSVRPNLIYAAHFEQKVLFWFIYFCPSNPKVLSDWIWSADVHIQSAWVETLPRSFFEDFWVLRHTTREMLHPARLRGN